MPWIKLKFNRFKLGIFRGFPPHIMMGWVSVYWIGNQHFLKVNKALKAAEKLLNDQNAQ